MGLGFLDYQFLLNRFDQIDQRLIALGNKIDQVLKQEGKQMGQLDDITQAVQNETSVDASAVTLLNELSAKIDSLKNDPAALAQLSQQIQSNSQALAAAIAANTPADTSGGSTGATGATGPTGSTGASGPDQTGASGIV